ncbi:MAG: serine hydrolase [Hyphomicrobiales bacterium]
MWLLGVGQRRRFAIGIAASLGLAIVTAVVATAPAEARHHSRFHRFHRVGAGAYHPPFSAIVVDAKAGKVLYSVEAKAPRHPASITKVMTLYLLFEQLERGAMTMDTQLRVSEHAASMAPTKLGLDPGDTISVSDAIKAVVTKSANDMAVAIAEQIGGSEEAFAELMTRKARALGMNDTHFVNASGLPDDDQVTTAYDLAILARAIQERFPRYYPLFATRSFYYGGVAMRNHNHLLGRIEGVDGIKTGYTRASGFNLMTNVRRDGRQIVAVVLGGASAASRDRTMANLIEDHLEAASAGEHTAPALAEASQRAKPAVVAEASAPARPPVKPPEFASAATAEDAHLPATIQAYASTTTPSAPRWSVASKLVQAAAERQEPPTTGPVADAAAPAATKVFTDRLPARPLPVAATAPIPPETPDAPKAILAKLEPAKPEPALKEGPAKNAGTKAGAAGEEAGKALTARLPDDAATASISARPKFSPRLGWMIQLGAIPEESKATELLERAKTSGPNVLAKAESFTEKVTKDGTTLFRARFAGFDEDAAQAACKVLKRNGFACFATRS